MRLLYSIGQHVLSGGMSIFAHSGCRRQSPVVVGDAVGANDGPTEGAGEGDSEGPVVGISVGDDDGLHVGASVFSQHPRNSVRLLYSIGQHALSGGMLIFAHSGCRRQSPGVVGDADGEIVGPAEGAGDGDSEGLAVGSSVGLVEGTGVGARVLSQQGKYVRLSPAGQQSML